MLNRTINSLLSIAIITMNAQENFFGRRRTVHKQPATVEIRPTVQRFHGSAVPSPLPTVSRAQPATFVVGHLDQPAEVEPGQVDQPAEVEPDQIAQPEQEVSGQIITEVECPEKEGLQVYPHPQSCNEFYKCANGTLTLEICANGLLFNVNTALSGAVDNHCSYNWQTNCHGRRNDSTPISSSGCKYQYGIFPVHKGCFTSYNKCAKGVPTEVPCQLGLAYDDRIHACNWPDLLVKSAGCDPSALVGGFKCPSEAELSPLARRFLPFPRFSIRNEPGLYIICVNGLPRLNSCGHGSLFSEDILSCKEDS